VVFSNPVDVLRALEAGMECRAVNIGGMHYVPGKRKLLDVLAVSDADLEALRAISGRGVKIVIQTVPTQRPIPLEKVLEACALKK
jgi:mannose/fructose/N-acetylgalactosamine-specific phosphotransferase system component IIB